MKARGAPEMRVQTPAPVTSADACTPAPKTSGPVTSNEKSARPARRTRKPVQGRAKKPVASSGYHFRKNGAGWDLRKDVYVTSNGVRKRKQPYLAHLSREAFQEMKRRHKGAALERAIAEWIEEHDR